MPDSLRPYQIDAIKKVYDLMVKGKRRIILQSPTGSGKTMMASRVIHDAVVKRGRSALVLAHRGELIDQLSDSLSRWGVEHGIIRAGETSSPSRRVQVASIQSLDGSIALPYLDGNDIIFVDEGHRRDADKVIRQYPQVRIMCLTATPYQMEGQKVVPLKGYDGLVVAATPSQLVKQRYIVPLKILAPPAPEAVFNVDSSMSKRESVMGQAHVMGDVVAHWKKYGARPTIGYCCGIRHAKAQANVFKDAGIAAHAISGEEQLEERREILAAFRAGKITCLFNSDLLIEGLDVPFVSRILMLRPTDSPAIYLQQTGRGVRIHDGKRDCEIFDHAGNFFVHGHPYWDRTTSLDFCPGIGRVKEDAEHPDAVSAWRCTSCFCVVGGGSPASGICPYCDEAVEYKHRRLKVVAGNLIEYDEEQLRRARAEQNNIEAQKAVNHSRIRSLYGVAFRRGMESKARDAFVFGNMAKFKKAGKTWEQFFGEVQKATVQQ